MTEQPVYESENITMCTDGKYRWVYELNLYKNPAIIKEVGRVMLISLVIVLVLISGFQIIKTYKQSPVRAIWAALTAHLVMHYSIVGMTFITKPKILIVTMWSYLIGFRITIGTRMPSCSDFRE